MTDFSNDRIMRLLKNIKGAVLVEYAIVLLVLSIVIWIVIIGIAVTIANHIESVASAAGAAATDNLPSMSGPGSWQ